MASETSIVLDGPVLEVLAKLLEQGRTQEVLEAVRKLIAHNEELERQLAVLGRRGTKANEGVSSAQLLLFLDELSKQAERAQDEAIAAKTEDELLEARAEAAAERARQKALAEKAKPKPRPLKKPLPAELPRRDNVIEVPESERGCPSCGVERSVIGHDIAEVLEFIPAQLYVRRDMREKRVCRPCEGAPVRAPRGVKIVEGGQLGVSVAVKLVCDKYELGLPLHRQRKTFKRLGMKLAVSTMSDQVRWVAELLRPLHSEAIDQVIASRIKHIDGTGLTVLDKNHPKGKRTGTLWSVAGGSATTPEVAAYFYASTKKGKKQRVDEMGPSDILALFSGYVVLDADILFHAERQRSDLLDCACNMHARRYFVKALDAGDTRAALVLGAYKGLYQVEEEFHDASDAERLAARREQSTPIYDDIVTWCKAYKRDTPPKTELGRAIRYLLNHETSLRRFETDGAIPIDNMAAEHNFVSVALTRKNFLFAGSDLGGERAAIIYTILRCCRLADVEPVEYLNDVLAVLSRGIRRVDIPKLMPAAWAQRRTTSADGQAA